VFGGKSKREIDQMIADNDADFVAYVAKLRTKRTVRTRRQLLALARELGEEIPEGLLAELE